MANQTKKEPRNLYDLSEVEEFLIRYAEWYARYTSGVVASSNPTDPPPPPPGPGPK